MIRYALICEHDHDFEAWFDRSEDFDDQSGRGLVECPFCASTLVRKQVMAPAVSGTKKSGPANIVEAMDRVRRHVESNFDYVGDRFAREARDIHEGASEARGIYGEATPVEVKALVEDGVPVAPLPMAAQPKAKAKLN